MSAPVTTPPAATTDPKAVAVPAAEPKAAAPAAEPKKAAAEPKKGLLTSADEPAADPAPAPAKEGEPEFKWLGAPEKYEDFQLPEGFTEAEPETLAEFQTAAKEIGLSQDGGQKIVNLGAKLVSRFQEKQMQAWFERRDQWQKAFLNDAEFGGQKAPDNLKLAAKTVIQFGGKEAFTALQETGLEDHPALLKMLVKIGRATQDDDFDATKEGGAPTTKSLAETLYPNQAKK